MAVGGPSRFPEVIVNPHGETPAPDGPAFLDGTGFYLLMVMAFGGVPRYAL